MLYISMKSKHFKCHHQLGHSLQKHFKTNESDYKALIHVSIYSFRKSTSRIGSGFGMDQDGTFILPHLLKWLSFFWKPTLPPRPICFPHLFSILSFLSHPLRSKGHWWPRQTTTQCLAIFRTSQQHRSHARQPRGLIDGPLLEGCDDPPEVIQWLKGGWKVVERWLR